MEITKKSQLYHDVAIRIVRLINILLISTPFIVAWYVFYADKLWVRFSMRGHWLVILLFIALYILIGRTYEIFKISYNSIGEMVYSQALTCFEVDVLMYIVALLLIRYIPFVLPFIAIFAVQLIFAILWCITSQRWYFRTFPAYKTIVVWDMRKGIRALIDQYDLKRKYKVVADASVNECLSDLSMLDGSDAVFLVGVHSHDRNIIVKYCLKQNIKAFLIPRVGDLIIASSKRNHMFHMLMLRVERYNPSFEYKIVKRVIDILLSCIAFVIASPLMLVTALAIKLEDKGPILYKQVRLTKDGKTFNILKYRSMVVDAEKGGVARLSSGNNDNRITKVGRIIRRYRIDELPQLINIIKGDLAIVGPRAERPEIAEEYYKELPEFELRLQAKAGLTGYAQVYGKYNTEPYDKLLMDLMYLANPSILEDVRIIFATIKILFMAESTEGVDARQTTAIENDNISESSVKHISVSEEEVGE